MNRETIEKSIIQNPLRRLQSVLDKHLYFTKEYANTYELLFATCEVIAKYHNIKLIKPLILEDNVSQSDYIHKIAISSDIRIRKVGLNEKWWLKDNGALLGFYRDQPCALLPKDKGLYRLIDLHRGRKIKVSEKTAKMIAKEAYYLYRPLPQQINGLKDIITFALSHTYHDLYLFFSLQAVVILLALLIPVFTGYVFSIVIPNADPYILWQIVIALIFSTVLTTLYSIVQAATLIRLRFKTEMNLQPAIWDRILRYPSHFFRRFSAGDLTFRASVINDIQQILSQSSLVIIVNGIMSIIFLGFMFMYSGILALAAMLLTLIIIGSTYLIIYKQLYYLRRLYYHFGKFIGTAFEILTGILKIRVADASFRVFTIWADRLANRSKAEVRQRQYLQNLETFLNVMMVINPLILYGLVTLLGTQISFGSFIAFNAAFTLFFNAVFQTSSTLSAVINCIPLWERAKTVISAKTDSEVDQIEPGPLDGDIKISHLVFRYQASDKAIFKDLSMEIQPGEFIALVGPSGTGKSTLFRLLLGFEKPQAGSIFYNGVNLTTLKLSSVRKQIGVVIQNSALIPGTILDNIIGNSTSLTRRDAWEIVAKVGLDELIKVLPMQMDTLITEGNITLSGGEKQRLILARALAQQPKIIFLDEATSALDNNTQAVVHQYLKALKATQVVAAHRLSTIINADRIYVIENGYIVQTGNFESLMKEPGLFAQLAKRQLQ